MSEYAALVSIDWPINNTPFVSRPKHRRARTNHRQHTPAALQEWALGLHQRFAGAPIAVCLEQSAGH